MIMHSFLLIGQSNMAGRGFICEAHPIDSSRIFVLRNGRWQKMFRPIDPDRAFSGVSLAESFAEAYSRKYAVDVGLIPCADGGTSLDQWRVGGLLYDHAVLQARLAQRTSTIAGVLWHQGESDCRSELYPTYRTRFEVMINSLRHDLGLYDTPIIIGGLGDYLKNFPQDGSMLPQNYIHVNNALREIALNDKMIGYASAERLTSNPDCLHFSSDGLYHFGLRYFDEFEKLRDPEKAFPDKPDADSAIRSEMELL